MHTPCIFLTDFSLAGRCKSINIAETHRKRIGSFILLMYCIFSLHIEHLLCVDTSFVGLHEVYVISVAPTELKINLRKERVKTCDCNKLGIIKF